MLLGTTILRAGKRKYQIDRKNKNPQGYRKEREDEQYAI